MLMDSDCHVQALVSEHCEFEDQQVVVLFQILAAEINFGYKFQTAEVIIVPNPIRRTVNLYPKP